MAAETLLYELWALLLRDTGMAEAEIDERRTQMPFASLIKRELAQHLGGSWDLTDLGRPVGHYWANLYLLRNKITHGGYLPTMGMLNRRRAPTSGSMSSSTTVSRQFRAHTQAHPPPS